MMGTKTAKLPPEPWGFTGKAYGAKRDVRQLVILDHDDNEICKVTKTFKLSGGQDHADNVEAWGLARLFRDAPKVLAERDELIAACKLLLEVSDILFSYDIPVCVDLEYEHATSAVNAAIAKA